LVLGQEYRYDVGPNYIDQSGSSCRAGSEANEVNVFRAPGEIQARGTGQTMVFCPVTRRTTTFYGVSRGTTANPDTALTVTNLTVTATDAGTGTVTCWAYADRMTTNSTIFGPGRFLCGTAGGCDNPPASYAGTNDITLQFPTIDDKRTLNFGFTCSLNKGSKVLYSSTTVTPNP
jgi:hypothetical protein